MMGTRLDTIVHDMLFEVIRGVASGEVGHILGYHSISFLSFSSVYPSCP